LPAVGIELFEYVHHAAPVVCEVEHIGDENPVVRTQRHEAHALQTLSGNADLIALGKVQIERFSVGKRDVVRRQFLC
jgi:hypothetical protein